MNGFVWDIDPTLLHIGPLQLRYYGILFGLTLLLGYHLFQKQMRKSGYDEKISEQFLIYGVLGVVVGARLVHCFFYEPEEYLANPGEIIKVWKGGIASHGATAGLFLVALWFSRVRKIPFFVLGDGIVFAAAVGATCVRIGNFFNSEIAGIPTTLPWGVKFLRYPGDLAIAKQAAVEKCTTADMQCLIDFWPVRHPSQIYEAAGGLLILLTLIFVDNKLKERRVTGLFSGLFLILYFIFRFFVEFLKEGQTVNDKNVLFGTDMGQWLSIPFIIIGGFVLYRALHGGFAAGPGAVTETAPQKSKKK